MSVLEILNQSHRMLEAARLGQWERVSELEKCRQKSLNAFVIECQRRKSSAADHKRLAEVQAINNRIIDLVKQSRDSTAIQIRNLSQGRKAVRTYDGITIGS